MIRMGSAIKRALQQVTGNMAMRASGLIVPPDYIAGKHYGGFHGYEPWIQDCIRAACEASRNVGQEELPELTALCLWAPPTAPDQPPMIEATIQKHAEIMLAIEKLVERLAAVNHHDGQIDQKVYEQVRRVQGGRELGSLMVLAINGQKIVETGDVMVSVSAWRPADIEEAKAEPRRKYVLG